MCFWFNYLKSYYVIYLDSVLYIFLENMRITIKKEEL